MSRLLAVWPFVVALLVSIGIGWGLSFLGAPTWAAWGFGILAYLLLENRIIYQRETERRDIRTYLRALRAFLDGKKS